MKENFMKKKLKIKKKLLKKYIKVGKKSDKIF